MSLGLLWVMWWATVPSHHKKYIYIYIYIGHKKVLAGKKEFQLVRYGEKNGQKWVQGAKHAKRVQHQHI